MRKWRQCTFLHWIQSSSSLLEKQAFQAYKNEVYLFPKPLDENVTKLHISSLGTELIVLTREQAFQAYKNEVHLLSKALDENLTKFQFLTWCRAHRLRRPFRGMKSSKLPR